jgi:hypothetical protein
MNIDEVIDYIVKLLGNVKGFITICNYDKLEQELQINDEEDLQNNGVSIANIANFCKKYDLPLYVIGDFGKTDIIYKYKPEKLNANYRTLCFRLSNNHIYPIMDKNEVKSIIALKNVKDKKNKHVVCNDEDDYGLSNLKHNIQKKLSKYKHTDKNKFGYESDLTYEDVLELLEKQNFTCYICNDNVITSKWKPYCCYQFSVDRIDDRLPHNKNNVLISCYYCNCRYFSEFNQDYKICDSGCHTVQRILPHKREVSKDKIDALLLK